MPGVNVSWWRCRRYWLAFLLFLGFTLFSLLRVNLSIIIVCMVKHGRHNASHVINYNTTNQNRTSYVSFDKPVTCERQSDLHSIDSHEEGEFDWDKQMQGILLGGFFWGYASGVQVLGGWLAQRYGARTIMTLGILPQAVGTLLSPVAARVSPYLFLVIRIIMGFTTGVTFPTVPVFWSRWAPPDEWSRLLTFTYAGGELGNAMAFPINGYLCSYGGWELPFYSVGAVGVVWCLIWYVIARDCPSKMPGITEAEKCYLSESAARRVSKERVYKTPWRSIFRSVPVWACVFCHVLSNFFFYMVLTQAPTYLNEVMNFDIRSNGVYSSLPYIGIFLLMTPVALSVDFLTSRGYLSLGVVRKLYNTIGMIIPALCLLALGYVPCTNPTAGVALITASLTAFSFCYSGHVVNHADIAVMHSGVVAGFSNNLAALPGIIAPFAVSLLTKQGTQEEWRTAFYIAIVLNVVGATVFLFFSSGDPQPWALPPSLNITKKLDVPEETPALGDPKRSIENNISNEDVGEPDKGELVLELKTPLNTIDDQTYSKNDDLMLNGQRNDVTRT